MHAAMCVDDTSSVHCLSPLAAISIKFSAPGTFCVNRALLLVVRLSLMYVSALRGMGLVATSHETPCVHGGVVKLPWLLKDRSCLASLVIGSAMKSLRGGRTIDRIAARSHALGMRKSRWRVPQWCPHRRECRQGARRCFRAWAWSLEQRPR